MPLPALTMLSCSSTRLVGEVVDPPMDVERVFVPTGPDDRAV